MNLKGRGRASVSEKRAQATTANATKRPHMSFIMGTASNRGEEKVKRKGSRIEEDTHLPPGRYKTSGVKDGIA